MTNRVIAARRSVRGFPAGLNAAEFAACSSRAASRGSVPTILTISVRLTSGSASALRIRITTSGKQGRFTVPFDTSVARLARNASATACSSVLVAAELESTAGVGTSGSAARVVRAAGLIGGTVGRFAMAGGVARVGTAALLGAAGATGGLARGSGLRRRRGFGSNRFFQFAGGCRCHIRHTGNFTLAHARANCVRARGLPVNFGSAR